MQALALTDDQLNQLRATAATLPPESRTDLVKLTVGFMQVEGDLASVGTFDRALRFALDSLYARITGLGVE